MTLPFPAGLRLFTCASLMLLAACAENRNNGFPGYAEGEYVRIASPFAGSLATLSVKRGDSVVADTPLFALEHENERAGREEAAARVRQAESQLENLRKGKRPEELAAARALVAQAEASLTLSTAEMKRTEDLVAAKFLSPAKLDETRSALARDRSRVAELNAQLQVAKLAGRPDDVNAAAAEVKAAKELLAQADWKVAQKSQRAPHAALVADTFYTTGEWVQAGMPVVSLLPAENIKVKFFVAETQLAAMKIGQEVQLNCDGCTVAAAIITYVAPQAEYTSPLIYSKENRATLVFLIEARAKPGEALRLHPGQPVEVRLPRPPG